MSAEPRESPANRDERGMALITTLVVIVVASMLGVASVSLADHAISRSARDRGRSAALHAAEAGLHDALARLAAADGATWCGEPVGPDTVIGRDPGSPGGEQWETSLSDSGGVAGTCDPNDGTRIITATGWSPRQGAPNAVTRTIQAEVELVAGAAEGAGAAAFPDAVYSGSTTTPPVIDGSVAILGDGQGEDAGVASRSADPADALTISGVVHGPVTAAGPLVLQRANVTGSVRATGDISVADHSRVGGDTTSHTGAIDVTEESRIGGSATAGGALTHGTDDIGGAARSGQATTPLAIRSLPDFTFSTADPWPGTITTWTTCADFLAYVQAHTGGLSGTHRITSDCPLVIDSAAIPGLVVSVTGSLAIVTDGTVEIDDVMLQRSGGGTKTVQLISRHAAADSSDTAGVTVRRSGFRNLPTFLFAANRVTRTSSIPMAGQIAGDTVVLGGTGSLTLRPMTPSGFTFASADDAAATPGFTVRLLSTRETTGQ